MTEAAWTKKRGAWAPGAPSRSAAFSAPFPVSGDAGAFPLLEGGVLHTGSAFPASEDKGPECLSREGGFSSPWNSMCADAVTLCFCLPERGSASTRLSPCPLLPAGSPSVSTWGAEPQMGAGAAGRKH